MTLLATAAAAAVFRRWLEPMPIGVPMVLEATALITTTAIVERPRPPVQHLGDSGAGTSFPSGHMAAAVFHSAISVVGFLHRRGTVMRTIVVVVLMVVLVVVPLLVGCARVHRGMHDVTAGLALG
ncbi:MAG: phosphatase PAP2 family protein [Ilumatobacteraceae bacterium]